MRNHIMMSCAGLVLLCWVSPSRALMAPPDPTPLLFDRVKTFDAVVVATVADGFEKQARPLKNTNAVAIPIRIERVLRGSLKPGEFLIETHGNVPGELARRDPIKDGRRPDYLLAVMIGKGGNLSLGGGHLGLDLARFIPTDPSLEKTVAIFADSPNQQPMMLLKMCGELLNDPKLSAAAAGHVIELAARSTREWVATGPDSRATRKTSVEALASAVLERGKRGESIPAVAGFAGPAIDCGVDQAKVLDPAMAPALRKWLADALAAITAKAASYPDIEQIADVADALGRLKDKDSVETIVGLLKEPWMMRIFPRLRDALTAIVGEDEAQKIAPAAPNNPRGAIFAQ